MIYNNLFNRKYGYILFVAATLQGCGAGTSDSDANPELGAANESIYATADSSDSETQLVTANALSGLTSAQTASITATAPVTAAATAGITSTAEPAALVPVAVESAPVTTASVAPTSVTSTAATTALVTSAAITEAAATPAVVTAASVTAATVNTAAVIPASVTAAAATPAAVTAASVTPAAVATASVTPVATTPASAETVAVSPDTVELAAAQPVAESELVDAAIAAAPKPPTVDFVEIAEATETNTVVTEPVAAASTSAAASETVDFQNDLPSSIQCYEFPEDNIALGQVDNEDWRAWVAPTTHRYSGSTEFISIDQTDEGKPTLRQQLVPNSKGSQTVSAGADLTSEDTYRLTQAVYLEPGFDWGGTNEGGKLGFGFGGGSAPSGGLLQTDGFTVRFMWRGNKDGTAHMVVYSYAADRQQSLPYGDDYPLEGFDVPIGEWFDLAMEVTVNSAIDKADGSLKAWANGELLLELEDIQWQSSGDQPAVQRLIYTTFYGGNDSTWSPDETTYIRFADVCWSPVIDEFEPLDPTLGSARNAEQFQATKDSQGTIYSDYTESEPQSVEFGQFADSARASIINAISDIELMLPAQNELIDWYFYNALDRLNESLDAADWIDNYSVKPESGTVTHVYEAVRDALAAALVADAPDFVKSQVASISASLALAAVDLAEDQIIKASSVIAQCTQNCQQANATLQRAQAALATAIETMATASITAIEHAEQARKTAIEAIALTSN